MAEKIVGAILPTSLPTDLLLVNRDGDLNEMLASALGIDHIAQTDITDGLRTYTLYRSADDSVIFGTIQIQDGTDATGLAIPNYSAGQEYFTNDCVIDDDTYVYRLVSLTSATGSKPQSGGVIDPLWERLFVGQEGQAVAINSSATAANANEYFADTTSSAFTLTIPAAVKSFVVEDYDDTWKHNAFTVDIGTDQFEFNIQQTGVRYTFRRIGTQFRVSGTDGSVLWGNV